MAKKRIDLAAAMRRARGDELTEIKNDAVAEDEKLIQKEETAIGDVVDAPARRGRGGAIAASTAPSRFGKKFIGGYFEPEVLKQLKLLGIEYDLTNQDLVAEALNLVFEKYGKNPIA